MFKHLQGVHVDDVAEAHIRALSLADKPVSSFLLAARDRSWKEVLEFANKKYPDAGFYKGEVKEGDRWIVETARAEKELGFGEWKEMEEQVTDVVEQQLALRKA